jgi:hypothetical protein
MQTLKGLIEQKIKEDNLFLYKTIFQDFLTDEGLLSLRSVCDLLDIFRADNDNYLEEMYIEALIKKISDTNTKRRVILIEKDIFKNKKENKVSITHLIRFGFNSY